jgi:uncharacterized protein
MLDASASTLQQRFEAVANAETRSLLLTNPRDVYARLRIPVLLVHGSRDVEMPAAVNLSAIVAALGSAGNQDFTAVNLPGLNHQLQTCKTCESWESGQLEETLSPAALDLIGDWLVRR